MPLTLEQYAEYLDTRDLPWPEPPTATPPKAKPHLKKLPDIRLVAWNLYGTLLVIPGGELYFHHPQKFIMEIALDKTVQEYKMWFSMTRKPGQPSEYMQQLYDKAFDQLKMASTGGERHPEIVVDRIWDNIIKKLFQKDYEFDASFFGSLNEYTRKVAYFFHASMQGTACYPKVADALKLLQDRNVAQGLLADAQCFSLLQLQRGLAKQGWTSPVSQLFADDRNALSFELGCRKPSENLFGYFLKQAKRQRRFARPNLARRHEHRP